MPAGRYNLEIEAGATYARALAWKQPLPDNPRSCIPKDLTGWTAKAQLRESAASADPLLTLTSSPTAGLTIDGPNGTVTLTITAAQTSALDIVSGVWALEMTAGDGVTVVRLVEGEVVVSPEVVQ